MSDQMTVYHQSTSLSEIEQRFRWIACYQLEHIFSRIFPHLEIYPFGSSVNGCGKTGSDLDLVASLIGRGTTSTSLRKPLIPLAFSDIPSTDSNRAQIVHYLGICSEALKISSTGCTEVNHSISFFSYIWVINLSHVLRFDEY